MLVLLAHGSRDRRWRESINNLKTLVQTRLPAEEVRVAFMQFEGPTLPEVVQEAARAGHSSVRLLPLFMASAGHVDKDIKPLVAELSESYPNLELFLFPPVGEDTLFPGLISDIATGPSAAG